MPDVMLNVAGNCWLAGNALNSSDQVLGQCMWKYVEETSRNVF